MPTLIQNVTGTATLTTAATSSSPAGTYPITFLTKNLTATNYSLSYVNGTLTLGKAALTVTANNASRAYGAANPAFAYTIKGYVNGDTGAVVKGTATLTTAATSSSPAGTYPITFLTKNLTATNYSLSYVNGTLTVTSAKPTITSLEPNSAVAGGTAFNLTIKGTNFASNAVVKWGITKLATTYFSASKLTATIPATLIATAGKASVTVTTSEGTSTAATFIINPPLPTITKLSPESATAGGPAFLLTISGTNFTTDISAKWNNTSLTTTYGNATTVWAVIPPNLIAATGKANITVTTAGGTSVTSAFTIK